jgi:hypothetical protein
LLTDHNDISNRNRGLSIDASYQVSVYLANSFRGEEFFKSANQNQESMRSKKKLFFCGKGDNSNLNIDISKIQLATCLN